MLEKTFINLSNAAYKFIEGRGLADGTVLDYPLAELDDLISGKVGDTEQTLYARYVNADGEVRFGELTQVNITRFDNHYRLEYEKCEGINSYTVTYDNCTVSDLGKVIEKAVAEYAGLPPHSVVRVLAVNSDNTTSKVLELGITL
jgi:hypothetical protein